MPRAGSVKRLERNSASRRLEKKRGAFWQERDAKRTKEIKAEKIKVSVPVPEGLMKSWELQNRATASLKAKKAAREAARPALRAKQAARIRGYEAGYLAAKKERLEKTMAARQQGNFYLAAQPKVLIVIRIRGINRMSPKARKILQLLRLLQIHSAVFVKVNKATINMLKVIQPYIAYGYPNLSTIRSLVYKRGFAKIRHKPGSIDRIPIMDNDLIEKYLGKYSIDEEGTGVETLEDLVHQVYTCGPRFRECTNFLWPFKLNCPRGGYRGRKRRHFNEGGSYGNWEYHINNFVMRML